MGDRAKIAAGVVGLVAGFGTGTWLLSWLLQWICQLTIAPHQAFSTNEPSANRLALATVLWAALVIALFKGLEIMDGWTIFLVCLFVWSVIAASASQWEYDSFAGTAVTTHVARFVYIVVMTWWGYLLYYVCWGNRASDETEQAADGQLTDQ